MYDDLRGFDCSEEVDEDMANAMIDCPVAILKSHDDFAKCDTLQSTFISKIFVLHLVTPINAT